MFLWHTLQYSSKAGLLHLQCELLGVVDSACLQAAWQQVVQQHPTLRTSIHWEKVKQPLQVVAHQVALPWQVLDWRHQDDWQTALEDWLNQDHQAGFDLNKAPLLRVCLIRLEETRYQLVCTTHHILLDGWSGNLILNQVFDYYQALFQGQKPPKIAITPYQNYVRWLKAQDEDAAAQFWTTELQGAVAAKRFTHSPGGAMGENGGSEAQQVSISLAGEEHRRLQTFLRSQQLTLSCLFSGIWALSLHLNHGEADVIFGMTVSGRHSDLPGVETIVGLLSNVLPIRVQVEREVLIREWLKKIQIRQAQLHLYSHSSPIKIQDWIGENEALFNSLLVIENHQSLSSEQLKSLKIQNLKSGIVSNYDLTILIKPKKQSLDITLQSRDGTIQPALLKCLGLQVQSLLTRLLEQPHQASLETWLKSGQNLRKPVSTPPAHQHHLAQMETDSRELLSESSPSSMEIVPPHNLVESKLLEIWESVLSISPISIHNNFFRLGGSSLSAARLFNQLEQIFELKLPLSTLFEAPTIAQLSHKLQTLGVTLEEQAQDNNPTHHSSNSASSDIPSKISKAQLDLWGQLQSLVPIQQQGSHSPFYFVPGGSGGIDEEWITYGRLLSALGSDRPIYGLRARGLKAQENCHHSVQEMAKDYIAEIQAIQPHGPYFLGGECIGGLIAYEIAQQLLVKGESVQSLFLLDTNPKISTIKTFFYHLLHRLSIPKLWDYCRFLSKLSPEEAIHQVLKQVRRRIMPEHDSALLPQRQASIQANPDQVSQNYKTIALRYHLKPYLGKLVVIATPDLSSQRKQAQWHNLAQGEFCFHSLSSDHHAYIREESEQTAQVIRQHLGAF